MPRTKDPHLCVAFSTKSSSVVTIQRSFEQDLQRSTKQTGVVSDQGSGRRHVALHTCLQGCSVAVASLRSFMPASRGKHAVLFSWMCSCGIAVGKPGAPPERTLHASPTRLRTLHRGLANRSGAERWLAYFSYARPRDVAPANDTHFEATRSLFPQTGEE